MSDVSISLGVTGKEQVTGTFKEVGASAKEMSAALMEHTKKLGEMFLGYEAVVKVVETFKKALEVGKDIDNLSQETGMAAGQVAVLLRAFDDAGIGADKFGPLVNKMQKFIEGAGDASGKSAEALANLGLTTEDLAKLSPDEQFRKLGMAINAIHDPAQKAAVSMEIFGSRLGGRTLALFNDYDRKLADASGSLGSYADQMDKSAEGFHLLLNGFEDVGEKATEFAAGILGDAYPALKTLVEYAANFDATGMGKSFSAALVEGINFALGIFRDPGDAFLAFGDALIVAFKKAINALDNGIMYVFDFASNYLKEMIPNAAEFLKVGFVAALNFVGSNFESMLAEIFTSVAGYLPDKFGKPLAEVGEKMRSSSEEMAAAASKGLGETWERIAGALAKASEETHLQANDYMDAASSVEQLHEHTKAVADNGKEFLDHIKESNEESAKMAEMTDQMKRDSLAIADAFSGATASFKDFQAGAGKPTFGQVASGGGVQGTLNLQGVGRDSSGEKVGPVASPRQRLQTDSGSSRPSYGRSATGPTLDENAAANKTAADFSAYTSRDGYIGDQYGQYRAGAIENRDSVIDRLQQRLYMDTEQSPAEARAAATKMYDEQLNKNRGPQDLAGGKAGGNSSGGKPASDPIDAILKSLQEHLPQIDKNTAAFAVLS